MNFKLVFTVIFFCFSTVSFSQSLDSCPKPNAGQFMKLCDFVETQDSRYDQLLKQLSCVKDTDSEIIVKTKVQIMRGKYKDEFRATREGFSVDNGNILKLSIASNYLSFICGLVEDYEVDINFADKADNKNVLDFTQDEIDRLTKMGRQDERIEQLHQMYNELVKLKAKHTKNYKRTL